MKFEELVNEDRRLCELRILAGSAGSSANHIVMQALLAQLGHNVSSDRVLADMAWLEECGLVTSLRVADGQLAVAILTQRGQDVSRGFSDVPGVKRALPGDV